MQQGVTTVLPPPPTGLLRGASLFLDFDGTLVEIASRPDAVRVEARLHTLIQQLAMALGGRIAVVSGRPAGQVQALLGDIALTIVGSHGMEFRYAGGDRRDAARPATLDAVFVAMTDHAARWPGVLVEQKPLGTALHYREAAHAKDSCITLATRLADDHGLYLQPGKMMIEVRAAAGDKGSAIATLMTEPDWALTTPIFLGDDVTDEAGFRAVAALDGAGVLVGPDRETAARYRLKDVPAVLRWLEAEATA